MIDVAASYPNSKPWCDLRWLLTTSVQERFTWLCSNEDKIAKQASHHYHMSHIEKNPLISSHISIMPIK